MYNVNINNMTGQQNAFSTRLVGVIRQVGKAGKHSMKELHSREYYRTIRDHSDHSLDKCDIFDIANQNLK